MVLVDSKQNKIMSMNQIVTILKEDKQKGLTIVQCHGVFDLIHPGHIRHFREAKSKGDRLVVSITPDRFVNKGPGRPAFPEDLRLESLAALEDIDYVVLNDAPDAVSAIVKIQPDFYVKGIEYSNPADDVTGKISEEARAVESVGGKVYFTDDIVFSSSTLLNRYFEPLTREVSDFLTKFKADYTSNDIIKKIEAFSKLKVLVIGDAIVDEYQYTNPLGQSGKGLHMVARCLEKDAFLGGALIIANHVAEFVKEVTLVTAVGKNCPYANFISQNLDKKVKPRFSYISDSKTLVKKRYVMKDGKNLSKLFETYSGYDEMQTQDQIEGITQFLQEKASSFDLVLVCDFGNGFLNDQIVDAISDVPTFLAINTQINSGNRGYNVITKYKRADYISLNEPELRLAAHDRTSKLEGIASDISEIMNCKYLAVTRGVQGVLCSSVENQPITIPAMTTNAIDRIGAGDSYLAISSLGMSQGCPMVLSAFLGSLAAAMSVQMIGNQESIKKAPLCKYLIRMMK